MKKLIVLSILLVCGNNSFLKASLTNTERAVELSPSYANDPEGSIKRATDELFTALLSKSPGALAAVKNALERGADSNAQLIYHYSLNPLLVIWVTPSMLAAITPFNSVEILKALAAAGADHTIQAAMALNKRPTQISALTMAKKYNNSDAEEYLCDFKIVKN